MKLKDMHILIVDDNPKNIQVLGQMLNEQNYKIVVATNGAEAVKAAQAVQPDLILLDVMMPVMDGFEACKQLKGLETTSNIPVIFLTAKNETDDLVKGFELGAVDYVTKPFNSAELLARVRTHLELNLSRKTILRQSQEREEILHILCHDLSNPIWAAQTGLQFAKNPQELFERKENIVSVLQHASNIIKLVRTLRAISTGKHKIVLTGINLSDAVEQSLEMLQYKLTEKEIFPAVHIDASLHVKAEKISLINSVLNNILTNAIKFSFAGNPLKIEAEKKGSMVVLSIRDYGIGIPKNLKDRLFAVDQETTRFGTNGEQGTGFGMPLVKGFVTAYEGSIEVLSEEKTEDSADHGTTILIKLQSDTAESADIS
ncbi:MAG: hybrid sensor histidine kinase/response regulator [SAR324 cluster bacterium]|nr:hybrid sensor histidine kinase/response regulator [SAR324 cluster bacterium]